ncbi:MerR family transcriptional regulator [Burkholderia pseudomallei]|uniref:MerR family transcriptional regulator n=2 Tax=Burkholderia pseudomallei TaxID=28450 RepID=A0AAX0U6E5_BURPE|nr:hypothetical protein BPC006_II0179 [Burkholderia pseudomallei BPC006]ARK45995.1 MerR family transcriptional regulator [Burkholderia pseudomallei]ARK55978.1 MerR family transcriptional regulator [Burkholderia pseudomallei]ARK59047.1 MerR family transcriptional regulator [Burkholderia pseudomallei]ARK74079.1 MerR family transcriptional regulator [Burkholderia pseudomallei]
MRRRPQVSARWRRREMTRGEMTAWVAVPAVMWAVRRRVGPAALRFYDSIRGRPCPR